MPAGWYNITKMNVPHKTYLQAANFEPLNYMMSCILFVELATFSGMRYNWYEPNIDIVMPQYFKRAVNLALVGILHFCSAFSVQRCLYPCYNLDTIFFLFTQYT